VKGILLTNPNQYKLVLDKEDFDYKSGIRFVSVPCLFSNQSFVSVNTSPCSLVV